MGGGDFPPTSSPEASCERLPLRVITHNVRYATNNPFKGELPWSQRRPHLTSSLLYNTRTTPSSILCLQEVLHEQLQDIVHDLNHHTPPNEIWKHLGVGRDDGKEAGEYSPILYRSDVFCVIPGTYDTLWLSPTPRKPGSKGWDAASPRILTKAVLRHRTGKKVQVMSTHFDDQGKVARMKEAQCVVATMGVAMDADAWVLGGDLNSEVTGDAYKIINGAYEEGHSGLRDVKELLSVKSGRSKDHVASKDPQSYGEENTFTGFDGEGDGDGLKRIDFIFLATNSNCQDVVTPEAAVQGYAVLPNRFEAGVYTSDHRAVVADLLI